MKKIILLSALVLAFWWQGNSQAVNQPANWPNTAWTLDTIAHTGTNAMDIEANPLTDPNFAYDDDDTGSGSHDEIAAESPVIDLTPAASAGEYYIVVSGQYVYNNISANEKLALQYWDADNSQWVDFYVFPLEDTPDAPTDNYCAGTPVDYNAVLNIQNFTATQLSGFKYRIYYSDNVNGDNAWVWGFCFASPTLHSASILPPQFELAALPDCDNNQFSVQVVITDLAGSSSVTVTDDQGSDPQQVSATDTIVMGPYPSGTEVTITVTSDDDNSAFVSQSIIFFCPPPNDACETATGIDAIPYVDSLDARGATNNNGFVECDGSIANDGVWYTLVASEVSDSLTVTVTTYGWDAEIQVFSGSCDNLQCVAHVDNVASDTTETLTFLPEAGVQYYINVGEWHGSADHAEGPFVIEITGNATVSATTLTYDEFTFYPNPTTGTLRWNAKGRVETVQLADLTGKLYLNLRNPAVSQADISRLPAGIYILRVRMDGKEGVYKVIKK